MITVVTLWRARPLRRVNPQRRFLPRMRGVLALAAAIVTLAPSCRPQAQVNGGFKANYYNAAAGVTISCDRTVQMVAPFRDISSCYEEFAVPRLATGVRAYIRKTDVPQWRAIRAAALRQIGAFIVVQ